jgi:hypothetical protein
MTAGAMLEAIEAWSHAEFQDAAADASDQDPERGVEDGRVVAGERVRTFIDKVFGGRAVSVLRPGNDGVTALARPRTDEPGSKSLTGCAIVRGVPMPNQSRRTSRSARSAASAPHIPCTPTPGGVAAEQRYKPRTGVACIRQVGRVKS